MLIRGVVSSPVRGVVGSGFGGGDGLPPLPQGFAFLTREIGQGAIYLTRRLPNGRTEYLVRAA